MRRNVAQIIFYIESLTPKLMIAMYLNYWITVIPYYTRTILIFRIKSLTKTTATISHFIDAKIYLNFNISCRTFKNMVVEHLLELSL